MEKGATIIEFLFFCFVVAIIGFVSYLGFNIYQADKINRQRKTEISDLRQKLSSHYQTYLNYPNNLENLVDPKSKTTFTYKANPVIRTYFLCAPLEKSLITKGGFYKVSSLSPDIELGEKCQ